MAIQDNETTQAILKEIGQGDVEGFTKKINSYYFREESMCRQNSVARLVLNNTSY